MLDAYIIEEIKREEEDRRRHEGTRPRLHIEIPSRVEEEERDPEEEPPPPDEPLPSIRIDL